MPTLLLLLSLSAADLIIKNGNVVTVDEALPRAQAVAITKDRITAVGSDAELGKLAGPKTKVIDAGGALVLPGFIEGHGHFMMLGRAKTQLDLTRAKSWDEIVGQVAAAAKTAKKGDWILGDGWHQEKWSARPEPQVEGNPVHGSLSKVSPDNPVRLMHASGHASFVNAKALELAGITRDTKPPQGGEILHDAEGNPTGMLRETAQTLLPDPEKGLAVEQKHALWRRYVELAGAEALSKGVTSFQDLGANFETIELFKRLADEGKLPVRLYPMVRWESNDAMAKGLKAHRLVGYGKNFLTVRAIKRQIDGALGAHGAWLLAPYADLKGSTGLNLETPEDIARTAELALANGYQLAVHAIGDRANRETLDLYERAFASRPALKDLRWRIEHAQHVDAADVPRFKKLGVIASMQGNHCTSDGPWVLKRLGPERAKAQSYLWRTFLNLGVVVTNGTDVPVEDIDPLGSFYAAVTRQMADGQAFFPEQKMSREEALRSYTMSNAYAAFEEGLKGSLTEGKLADVVVLSKDILTVPEAELRTAKVLYTIVGGQVRYAAPK